MESRDRSYHNESQPCVKLIKTKRASLKTQISEGGALLWSVTWCVEPRKGGEGGGEGNHAILSVGVPRCTGLRCGTSDGSQFCLIFV